MGLLQYFQHVIIWILVTKEELRAAEDKFEESKELCYSSMMNLMDSDVSYFVLFQAQWYSSEQSTLYYVVQYMWINDIIIGY